MRRILLAVLLLTALTAEQPPAAPIGIATMAPDGTVTLRLRAESQSGTTTGEGQLIYRPGDAQYDEVLRHLGGLKPGESKSVPPWPDRN
jgi:hypothetical protein